MAIKIKFTTIERVLRHTENILLTSLRKIINIYLQHVITLSTLLIYHRFKCLRDKIPDINLNIMAAD